MGRRHDSDGALRFGHVVTGNPALKWIPPCRARLEKPEDYPPGELAPVPLLEGLDT